MSTNIFFKKKIPPKTPNPIPENPNSNIPSNVAVDVNANKIEDTEAAEAEEMKALLENPILVMKRSDFFSLVDRETEQNKFLV